jgi:hypothetical protein
LEEHVVFIFRVEESMKAGGKPSVNACFLLGLFFDPEDGGDIFFQNVS